jgi:hypothetical protein
MKSGAPILINVLVALGAAAVLGFGGLFIMGAFFRNWVVNGPKLQAGTNWIPRPINGPLELRPLPSAVRLLPDFAHWVKDSPGARVRLYEAVLPAGASQLNFTRTITWGETPLGRAPSTTVQFDYLDPSNGLYHFYWSHPGEQSDEWLRVGARPLRLLVRPCPFTAWPRAEISVEAIKGVEASMTLVAEDDHYLLTTATNADAFLLQSLSTD